jgi:hypothetical protein
MVEVNMKGIGRERVFMLDYSKAEVQEQQGKAATIL